MSDLLVGVELWRDKHDETDCLVLVRCELDGWAVSNVRKGTTRNVWEFSAKAVFEGSRGGASLTVCVTCPSIEHDLLGEPLSSPSFATASLPACIVESTAGSNEVILKVLDASGAVVERRTGEVISAERAMKTNEMLLKLVNRKGVALVRERVAQLLPEILAYGRQTPANEGSVGSSVKVAQEGQGDQETSSLPPAPAAASAEDATVAVAASAPAPPSE